MYTKNMNDGKHVFVFGSNSGGYHGAGAARQAYRYWGAKWGIGIGRTGNSYAIPTKSASLRVRPLHDIESSVAGFIGYAKDNPSLTFLVTAVGCGLAGYSPKDIAPMFEGAPSNCVLPDEFKY